MPSLTELQAAVVLRSVASLPASVSRCSRLVEFLDSAATAEETDNCQEKRKQQQQQQQQQQKNASNSDGSASRRPTTAPSSFVTLHHSRECASDSAFYCSRVHIDAPVASYSLQEGRRPPLPLSMGRITSFVLRVWRLASHSSGRNHLQQSSEGLFGKCSSQSDGGYGVLAGQWTVDLTTLVYVGPPEMLDMMRLRQRSLELLLEFDDGIYALPDSEFCHWISSGFASTTGHLAVDDAESMMLSRSHSPEPLAMPPLSRSGSGYSAKSDIFRRDAAGGFVMIRRDINQDASQLPPISTYDCESLLRLNTLESHLATSVQALSTCQTLLTSILTAHNQHLTLKRQLSSTQQQADSLREILQAKAMAIEQARRELDIRQEDVRQRRERMFDTGLWLEREQQHLADGRVTLQQSEIILDETKRMRRQRIADLVRVLMRMYPMEIIGESTIDIAYPTSMEAAENGSAVSNAIIRVDNGYKPPQQLCIRGIPLSFPLRLPLSSSDDYAAISTALGYVATVVTTVANAIERPLRFPIVAFGSTSVIYDTTSQFRSTYGGTTSPRSRGSHLRTASDASTAVASHPAVPRLIAQQRQRRRRQLQMSQFNPPLPPPSLPTASSTANDNTADDMMPPPSPSVRKPLSNIPELSRIATVPAASISSVLASVASSAAAPITPVVRAVFGGDTFKREFEQAYDLGACCPLYITPAMGNALHAGGSSALNSASLSMGSPGSDTHGGSEAGEAYRFLRGVGLLVANIKQLMYDEHIEVDDGPIDILADLQKLLDSLMLVPPPKDPSSMPSSPQFVPSLCVPTY